MPQIIHKSMQTSCAPVGAEFGTPVDQELLINPATASVVDEVAVRLEASHAWAAHDITAGEAAGRALKSWDAQPAS